MSFTINHEVVARAATQLANLIANEPSFEGIQAGNLFAAMILSAHAIALMHADYSPSATADIIDFTNKLLQQIQRDGNPLVAVPTSGLAAAETDTIQ